MKAVLLDEYTSTLEKGKTLWFTVIYFKCELIRIFAKHLKNINKTENYI